jgi:type IV pilus assembly protein PilV
MSNCLKGKYLGATTANEAAGAPRMFVRKLYSGVGMLEFLVALLIFSVGMMGLLSAQLVGKKANFEASQRSVATALVRDILERMRANPGQIVGYQVNGVGDEASRLPRPVADCDVAACTAEELAAFDIWQWESLLLGYSEQDSVGYAGGLLTPRACIASNGGAVDVTISWRGVMTLESAAQTDCGPAIDVDEAPEGEEGDVPQRHQLTVSTFMVGR